MNLTLLNFQSDDIKVGGQYLVNGETCEVSFVDKEDIRLEGFKYNRSYPMKLATFKAKLVEGAIRKLNNQYAIPHQAAAIHSMTEKQNAKYDRKCHYVHGYYSEFGAKLPKSRFEEVTKKLAAEIDDLNPPGMTQAREWCKAFWAANRNDLSLLPKRAVVRTSRIRLDEKVDGVIHMCITDYYFKPERITERQLHRLITARLNTLAKEAPGYAGLPFPSLKAVRDRVRRRDPLKVIQAREGKWVARRMNKRGAPIEYEERIGARVEADCQMMDVEVYVEQFNITIRPYLVVLLDVATRCVIGWDISYGSPSANKTLRALKVAMSESETAEFRAVPDELIVDNGKEFYCEDLERVAKAFHFQIRRTAPKSPDEKPFVERVFRTFNLHLIHHLEGTKKSSPIELRDYDSEKEAVLTIDNLRQLFKKYLEEYYHEAVHDGLDCSPRTQWRMLYKEQPPRVLPAEDVRVACLSSYSCSIHGGRVGAENMQWYGPTLPTLAEHLSSTRSKPKALLLVDPDRIGTAYIQDPTGMHPPIQVINTLPERFHDLTLGEIRLIKEILKAKRKDFSDVSSLDLAMKEIHDRKTEMARLGRLRKEGKSKEKTQNKRESKRLVRAAETHGSAVQLEMESMSNPSQFSPEESIPLPGPKEKKSPQQILPLDDDDSESLGEIKSLTPLNKSSKRRK